MAAKKKPGRPRVEDRPKPINWRPLTHEQRAAWLEIGGPKWARRMLDEYIAQRDSKKGE